MNADDESILKPKKGSTSSKKAYLAGFNANETLAECSSVFKTSNLSPGASCQSAMPSQMSCLDNSGPNVQVL